MCNGGSVVQSLFFFFLALLFSLIVLKFAFKLMFFVVLEFLDNVFFVIIIRRYSTISNETTIIYRANDEGTSINCDIIYS